MVTNPPPDLCSRIQKISRSETIAINEQVKQLETNGTEVIDLSTGDPDLVAPEHVLEKAKNSLDRKESDYTVSKGLPELRSAIAEKLQRENGIKTTMDRIIVTPGAKQALFEAILAVINEGDETVLIDPSWVSYESMVKMAGGNITRVKSDPETGFNLRSTNLENAVSDKTQLLILNTPSIGGAVYSKDQLKRVRDLAVDHNFWVISDEIYEKLVYEGKHHSIASLNHMPDRTVTVNGFSKGYAMAGFRLGYLNGPSQIVKQASKIQSHTVTCATTFAQHAGIGALTETQKPVEEMRRKYKTRRDILVKELSERGVEVIPPAGAFYLFIQTDADDDVALTKSILDEKHVALMPGSAYGVPGSIRFAFTTPKENIATAVGRIEEYL